MSDRLTSKDINTINGADHGDIEIVFRCATCFCSFVATESQPVKSIKAKTCPACEAWSKVEDKAYILAHSDRTTNYAFELTAAMLHYAKTEKPEETSK